MCGAYITFHIPGAIMANVFILAGLGKLSPDVIISFSNLVRDSLSEFRSYGLSSVLIKLVDFLLLATDDDDDDAILVDAIVLVDEAVDVVSAIRAIVTGLLKKASLPPDVVAVKIAVTMSWRLDNMMEKEALLDDNNIATTRMSAGSGRRLIVHSLLTPH
jgi:hypothetical protein